MRFSVARWWWARFVWTVSSAGWRDCFPSQQPACGIREAGDGGSHRAVADYRDRAGQRPRAVGVDTNDQGLLMILPLTQYYPVDNPVVFTACANQGSGAKWLLTFISSSYNSLSFYKSCPTVVRHVSLSDAHSYMPFTDPVRLGGHIFLSLFYRWRNGDLKIVASTKFHCGGWVKDLDSEIFSWFFKIISELSVFSFKSSWQLQIILNYHVRWWLLWKPH